MRYLIGKFLKPYWKQITLAVLLILVQSMSNLYLPSLNAAIINNGVAKGNINYIVKTGGLMLVFALLLAACAIT